MAASQRFVKPHLHGIKHPMDSNPLQETLKAVYESETGGRIPAPSRMLQLLAEHCLLLSDVEIGDEEIFPLCKFLGTKQALTSINTVILNQSTGAGSTRHRRCYLHKTDSSAFSLHNLKLLRAVLEMVGKSSVVHSLLIESIPFPVEIADFFARSIVFENSRLRWLSLKHCPLGDKGLRALTNALSRMTTQVLVLESCDLSDESCNYLATIIKTQEALLDTLYWNSTLRSSGKSMVRGSPSAGPRLYFRGLLLLCVSGNRMSNRGLLPLAKVLKKNHWLLGLDIANNKFDFEGMTKLLLDLASGDHFRIVLLHDNLGFNSVVARLLYLMTSKPLGSRFDGLPDNILLMLQRWVQVQRLHGDRTMEGSLDRRPSANSASLSQPSNQRSLSRSKESDPLSFRADIDHDGPSRIEFFADYAAVGLEGSCGSGQELDLDSLPESTDVVVPVGERRRGLDARPPSRQSVRPDAVTNSFTKAEISPGASPSRSFLGPTRNRKSSKLSPSKERSKSADPHHREIDVSGDHVSREQVWSPTGHEKRLALNKRAGEVLDSVLSDRQRQVLEHAQERTFLDEFPSSKNVTSHRRASSSSEPLQTRMNERLAQARVKESGAAGRSHRGDSKSAKTNLTRKSPERTTSPASKAKKSSRRGKTSRSPNNAAAADITASMEHFSRNVESVTYQLREVCESLGWLAQASSGQLHSHDTSLSPGSYGSSEQRVYRRVQSGSPVVRDGYPAHRYGDDSAEERTQPINLLDDQRLVEEQLRDSLRRKLRTILTGTP